MSICGIDFEACLCVHLYINVSLCPNTVIDYSLIIHTLQLFFICFLLDSTCPLYISAFIYPSKWFGSCWPYISISTFRSAILPLQQMAEPHVFPILPLLTVTLYFSYILVFFTNHFSFCLCLLILKKDLILNLCSNGDIVLRIGTFTVNNYYILLW